MKLYNFENCPLSDRNGTYGGNSGDKEGILINNERWIVKYPKSASKLRDVSDMSYSSTPESEYIGSHIYEILGYDVHKTILGVRNGRVVVACKDLCDDTHRLIEFRQLKNTYNKQLNDELDKSISSTGSDHFVSLDAIIIHLKHNPSLQNIDGLKERFWDCVIIDGFINNNDRNNGNWGILKGPDGDKLCPVFDNGASFSPNVPDSKIISKLNNPEILEQGACNGITAYSLDGETNALFRDLVKSNIPDLKKALRRVVPLIKTKMDDINTMIDNIPISADGHKIISEERKLEYKKELLVRMEKILSPEYERTVKNKDSFDFKELGNQYIKTVLKFSEKLSIKNAIKIAEKDLINIGEADSIIRKQMLKSYLHYIGVNSNKDFEAYIKNKQLELTKSASSPAKEKKPVSQPRGFNSGRSGY